MSDTRDLTDRMRTCAAAMLTCETDILERAIRDAADLLVEASNVLAAPVLGWRDHQAWREALEIIAGRRPAIDNLTSHQEIAIAALAVLGEPMEIIPADFEKGPIDIIPPQHPVRAESYGDPAWIAPGGKLPGLSHSGTISPRACPQCDSRTAKKVRRIGKRLMFECPVCTKEWPFSGAAA